MRWPSNNALAGQMQMRGVAKLDARGHNVLKGEMSLIGPRPYMPNERSKIGNNIDIILAVKPGITGLWQVSGRNDLDFASRVALDVWYVRNWSVWKDIVILIKTVQVVLEKKGVS